MNENIDLTKILDGCPMGTKFYHVMYGTVRFISLDLDSNYPIMLSVYDDNNNIPNVTLTTQGTYSEFFDGECLLFPSKDQRDWNKFERFWDKPKIERFDPKTLKPFDKVLVRTCLTSEWVCDFFSNIKDSNNPFVCVGFSWKYCIPYNDKTKHLLGITNNCPKYYRYWEE